jgi:hypothetical protein
MKYKHIKPASKWNPSLPLKSSQLAPRPWAPEVQKRTAEPEEWSAGIEYDFLSVPILPVESTEAASFANPTTIQTYRDNAGVQTFPPLQKSPETSVPTPFQPIDVDGESSKITHLDPKSTIQRVVSNSILWPPVNPGIQTQITNLDSQIAAAETEAVDAVTANPLNNPTAYQYNYIRNPNQTTWGYVVEERLSLKASAAGWSTQHRLTGARPDYYRNDNPNGIEIFVDLTTQAQTANSGNHITQKLQNAGIQTTAPVAAADIYHAGLNPLGNGPGQVLQGLADDEEMLAYQTLSAAQNDRNDSEYDDEYSGVIEELGNKLPTAFQFAYKSKKRERQAIVDAWKKAKVEKKQHKRDAKTHRNRLARNVKFKAKRVVEMSDSSDSED